MKTVYLGTSAFAGVVLARLHESTHRPVLVVSRPDRRSGRGRKLSSPPTVEIARKLEIPAYQPEQVNSDEALERIAAESPDALIVCAFGALIKEPLLSAYPILNVHPSLLPRWRGAAPVERAILAGDRETGVSIMQLTAGLDSGPVCSQERIPIDPRDDYGILAQRLAELGAEMLVEALGKADSGELAELFDEQHEAGVTYAEKLTANDRRLDPSQTAAELALRVRALSPHIGAYAELADGSRLGVWEAAVVGGDRETEPGRYPLLDASDGQLELLTVQPPGKNRMAGDAYQRGQRR